MSENPDHPSVSVPFGDFPASESDDVGPPRLGWLIWIVLILDSVPCLFRLLISVKDVIDGHARHLLLNYPAEFTKLYGFLVGIGVCGLMGNALILRRKRVGIAFAMVSIVLVVVFDGIALWEHRRDADRAAYVLITGTVLARFCWLVFYGIVVRLAAKRLSRFQTIDMPMNPMRTVP
jgi:hypothetical protein